MDSFTLTTQLNALLQAIQLPFILESPVDLTPSLLLATLESILNVRIPIAHLDESNGQDDDVTSQRNGHIQTIKIFLGVLETDILQMDIGLSKLDPRRLAIGAWDEVVYIAEVLCWIGEELGLIQPPALVDKGKRSAQNVPEEDLDLMQHLSIHRPTLLPKAPTPSPSSTITFLPPFNEASLPTTPTTTTLLFATDIDDTIQTNITSPLATSSPLRQLPNPPSRPREKSSSPRPNYTRNTRPNGHCTPPRPQRRPNSHHRSFSSSASTSARDIPPDDSSFVSQSPPIRQTGQISLVDHESELSTFFAQSLSLSTTSSSPPPRSSRPNSVSSTSRHVTPRSTPKSRPPPKSATTPSTSSRESVNEQDWRTLISTSPDHDPRRTYQLLQKRTELMEELLRIRMSRRPPQ